MTLTEIETYLAIVADGSLVQAARSLGCTQSTVTARLQSLEAAVGAQLVERAKSGARLTEAGARFRPRAEAIARLWSEARHEAEAEPGTRPIRLACHHDLWTGAGARLFDHMLRRAEDDSLTVALGSDRDMMEWLASGAADVTLGFDAAGVPGTETRTLGQERLGLFGTDATMAADSPDRVATAADQPGRLRFRSEELALHHILRHGGAAVLPERIAEGRVKAGRLHLLKANVARRDVIARLGPEATWDWLDTGLAKVVG